MDCDQKDIVSVNLSEIKNTNELHSILKNSLGFPDFYGMNWNAFWDAITGLVALPCKIYFIGWGNVENSLPNDSKIMRELLEKCNDMYPTNRCTIIFD